MTYRIRIPALFVAVVLVVAACSSNDTPETTDTTTTPGATVTPTSIDDTTMTTDPPETTAPEAMPTTDVAAPTTKPPTTTTPTTNPTPSTAPGDPDWLTIVTDLRAIIDEITINPDPSRIGEVAVEGGDWEMVAGSAIRNSFERGERTIGLEPTKVVDVEFNGTPDDAPVAEALAVSVKVTTEARDLSNAQVVDSSGDVVFDLTNDNEPGELLVGFWTLFRTDDGWRVGRITS